MRSDELLNFLRLDAYIGDATQYPDQIDLVLLSELTHKLHTVFGDLVQKSGGQWWQQDFLFNTTAGRSRYTVPKRALAGIVAKIDRAPSATGSYEPLDEIPVTAIQDWEAPIGGSNNNMPRVYAWRGGGEFQLFPTPDAVYPMRITYYLRPPILTISQSSTLGGAAAVRGQVITAAGSTLTLNAKPFDNSIAVPASYASGTVDIIRDGGWHEVLYPDVQVSNGGAAVYTVTSGEDLSRVNPGDWVRVADQSDWPTLPDDFHRCLSTVAAIKVASQLNTAAKVALLRDNVESDLIRFRSIITPRNKSEPKQSEVFLGSRGASWGSRWLNVP